jgi:hypothetical protein
LSRAKPGMGEAKRLPNVSRLALAQLFRPILQCRL